MTGRLSRRRHGLAGLLVALFVVGGLVFSYGLEHAPMIRWCTAHSVNAPVGSDREMAQGEQADAGDAAVPGAFAAALALHEPADQGPLTPVDACLCLAVLLSLLIIAMMALPRAVGARLPARIGWLVAPPARGSPPRPSLSSLQVLRL